MKKVTKTIQILQAVADGQATTKQIKNYLPMIPPKTLYALLAQMTKRGYIIIVQVRKVKTYLITEYGHEKLKWSAI